MAVNSVRSSVAPEVAETWESFCYRFLTRRSGEDVALHEVIEADPGFGAARAMAALLASVGGDESFDAVSELAAARTGRAEQPWERSIVSATATTVESGMWAAYDDWMAHTDDYPGDLLGFDLATLLLVMSTRPVEEVAGRAHRMLGRALDAAGEHPMLVGLGAMLAQEEGRLDDAQRLSSRALEIDPTGFDGAHPMTHVYFEAGDHADGLAWLDGWLPSSDQEAPFRTHLVWHAALHELELGLADDVLVRFGSCTARGGAGGLFDGSSLLWRCQLLGHAEPGTDPGETRVSQMVAPMRASVPFTFVGAHVAIGLATDNDVEGLRRFAADAAGFSAPGAAEILPDLALGFAAYVEGDYASASDHLLRRAGDFERLGGSHAQRQVFEDTLIHALIRAGRLEEASRRLQARLDRRPSRIDSALLNRALPASGAGAPLNRTPAPFSVGPE
jgi:tetratricopeptide (TPR) repeat protein